jgi:hypothetical protein
MKHVLKSFFGDRVPDAIWFDLNNLPRVDDGYALYVFKRKARRTLPQNALYWKWLTIIEESTGNRKEDLHELFKLMFNPREVMFHNIPKTIGGETKTLNKKEFSEYMNKVEQYAYDTIGMDQLPTLDTMTQDQIVNAQYQ